MPNQKRLVLVGGQGKRIEYFLRAAKDEHADLFTCSYEEYLYSSRPGDRVKLDPLPFEAADFTALTPFTTRYRDLLAELLRLPAIYYLNHPLEIIAALDKQETRRRLNLAGVAIAPALHGAIGGYAELMEHMQAQKMPRVFIKPRYGAGASGVLAFATAPLAAKIGQVLYTSLQEYGGSFQNTNTIHRIKDPYRQQRLLNRVLAEDCVIERWIPKANVNGINYDLRVVWQCGRRAFIVPRGSHGPITNLHLNDMALDLADMALSATLLQKLDQLCSGAMACFPGLCYAGLDVLLPPRDADPLVIEINAQGDLIYKDIFVDNRIYRQQVRHLLYGQLSEE